MGYEKRSSLKYQIPLRKSASSMEPPFFLYHADEVVLNYSTCLDIAQDREGI